MKLLTREEFKRQVFARAKGYCVFCDELATDAHHILDRKLFPDGGYYLENGVAVCDDHHFACEVTRIPLDDVYASAGIEEPALPPGFSSTKTYDKWGNEVISSTERLPGPLAKDDGCLRALILGGVRWQLKDQS